MLPFIKPEAVRSLPARKAAPGIPFCRARRLRYAVGWAHGFALPRSSTEEQPMKRALVGCALLALALNAVLVFFGRGSFGHFILLVIGVLYIAVPLFALAGVVLVVTAIVASKQKTALRKFPVFWGAVVGVLLSIVLGSSVLSWPVGSVVGRQDIARAKRFCDELVPLLDAYEAEHGQYPESLAELNHGRRRPLLLRQQPSFYDSNGETFRFGFVDPAGFLNGFEFSSKNRRWVACD